MFERYLACADLHITDKTPRYRKDDYPETCLRKLDWIVEEANRRDAILLISGDMFDSTAMKWEIVNRVIEILRKCKHLPVAIAGQHDMVNKVENLINTPLFNLWVSGVLYILGGGWRLDGIQGQQYGAPVPKAEDIDSIILVHKSITPEEPPFFLGDALSAEEAAKVYKDFRVVVSGDYHVPFAKEVGNVHIVNCGPMMRDKKDKRNLKPCVWYIQKRFSEVTVYPIEIPIESAEDVFDIKAIEYDEVNTVSVDTTKLKQLIDEGIDVFDFDAIVYKVLESTEFKFITQEDVASILTEKIA